MTRVRRRQIMTNFIWNFNKVATSHMNFRNGMYSNQILVFPLGNITTMNPEMRISATSWIVPLSTYLRVRATGNIFEYLAIDIHSYTSSTNAAYNDARNSELLSGRPSLLKHNKNINRNRRIA